MTIAADLIKGFIQGGGEQPEWKKDWGVTDDVASGIERSGLYGLWQFSLDAVQDFKHGGSGVGALLGPTIEQLADAAAVVGGLKEFDSFLLKSMPANALYKEHFGSDSIEAPVRQ